MDNSYYEQSGEERLIGPSSSSFKQPIFSNPRYSFASSSSPLLGQSLYCDRHPQHLKRHEQSFLPPYYQSMAQSSGGGIVTSQPPNNVRIGQMDTEDGINCSPCCDNSNIRRTLRALLLGQLLSLCLVGTGIASQILSNEGVSTPASQSFTNYFLLCFVYGISLSCKTNGDGMIAVLRKRGWKYFILALIDVEANFMIVYAYQFTNITSVQLLDCSTIPTVLLLSWLFLSVRYLISHVVGVCICLIGIACVIWADILDGKGAVGGNNKVLGDALCLGGSILYAVANVSEEFLVKQYSRMEYLGMIGLFGTIISGIQLALLEHQQLASIRWSGTVIGSFVLFAICMFIFYSLVTVLMQRTSALMLNLVTLSSDFYSLIIAIFLFKDSFHWLYFVSFFVVIIGSVTYSLRPTAQRDADEPRRVCPCLFLCCCCSECCFDRDGESSHGSIQITPLHTATQPQQTMDNGYGNEMMNGNNDPRFCPVHGRKRSRTSSTSHRTPSPYNVTQRNGGFFPS